MFKDLTIKPIENGIGYRGVFNAMASPCEILIESSNKLLATELIEVAYQEAKRIESKFSRYLVGNVTHTINHSHGKTIQLDQETAQLIDFALTCYQLSEHLFDITSGVLRQVWHFDGSDNIPSKQQVSSLLKDIGCHKIAWSTPFFSMPDGMEIDLGGIGKEYAIDSCLRKTQAIHADVPILLNFGGDLICNGPRLKQQAWVVGIEQVGNKKNAIIALKKGALATSGDANRYLYKAGIRYSHILNPMTGYPVEKAARSVTVAAESCIEAGLLSTMAILQGEQAEAFLADQGIKYWIQQ